MSELQCRGCTACCKRDVITLQSEDDASQYLTQQVAGRTVLQHKPGKPGECVYLKPTGCGIHGRAPKLCRDFDCRRLFAQTPKERRVIRIQQNPTMSAVYDAGRSRLKTLES